MKKVFVYGDSNVFGDDMSTGLRVPYHQRWVNRLKKSAKGLYIITDDGVSGRIAGDYRTDKPTRNGRSYFRDALQKVDDVDIVVIALGTNDLQERFNRSADDVIHDLLWYREAANNAKVIYLLPPKFDTGEKSGPEFSIGSLGLRDEIIERQSELGETIVINTVDLSDGLHFSVEGHKEVADIVARKLSEYA